LPNFILIGSEVLILWGVEFLDSP